MTARALGLGNPAARLGEKIGPGAEKSPKPARETYVVVVWNAR
jgi:hypothetical protein